MATATSYAGYNSRPHMAGANADVDIHLEAYEGDVEGSFRVESMFRQNGLTTFKRLSGTNVWRGDRLGGVKAKGRRSGEKLDEQRIVNDKLLITVDTTSYVRTDVDYNDQWTSPDFQAEYSAEHGSAHAKAFDQAHIIQLIKAGKWVAPTALKDSGAFFDGSFLTMTGYAAETNMSAKADILVQYHKTLIATFVKRDLGGSLSEFRTLIEPDTFNILLEHSKLMNVQFQSGGNSNDFVQRRIAYLNGIPVIETPRMPTAAITDHPLGDAFSVSAAEAKVRMIVFLPRKTLLTVEAQPMTVDFWNDKKEMTNVLDSYTMYNVGIRRGDCSGCIATD